MNFPGVDLVRKLAELRVRINNSGVERTKAILDGMGADCSYYRKSLDIFLDKDYEELKTILYDILNIMEKLDGNFEAMEKSLKNSGKFP
jgi:hypothetical protein